MRLVIAKCSVDYVGRLSAHLPLAVRLLMVKADGSVSIHADDRAYKPLNWMSPPCRFVEQVAPTSDPAHPVSEPLTALWEVHGRDGDTLQISIREVLHDSTHELGLDPGLQKDGVEAHLQTLLAEHPETLGTGWSLVRREHPSSRAKPTTEWPSRLGQERGLLIRAFLVRRRCLRTLTERAI